MPTLLWCVINPDLVKAHAFLYTTSLVGPDPTALAATAVLAAVEVAVTSPDAATDAIVANAAAAVVGAAAAGAAAGAAVAETNLPRFFGGSFCTTLNG